MLEASSRTRVLRDFNCPNSELWRASHFPKTPHMGVWSINKLLSIYPSAAGMPPFSQLRIKHWMHKVRITCFCTLPYCTKPESQRFPLPFRLGRTGWRRTVVTQITPVWQLTEPTESPRGEEKSNNFMASNTTSSIFSSARSDVFWRENVSVMAESSLVGQVGVTVPRKMESKQTFGTRKPAACS